MNTARRHSPQLLLAALLLALAGCSTAPMAGERAAREQLGRVAAAYRPSGHKPVLPVLGADSKLEDYVAFGVLNHPQVEAAYYDWRASVEAITPARAQPDPKLTFEADIADMLMTLMPGLMFDFMGAGKRAAMANEAAARSGVAYRAYVAAVLQTAAEVRKAWVELAYTTETLRLYTATLHNVDQSLQLAASEFSTGRGMVSFNEMVRLQNLVAEHHSHHAAFSDRRGAARARFKSALGLTRDEADPAWPESALQPTALPDEDTLWQRALAANPELGSMRAMVDIAVAEVGVANTTDRPDFAIGLMADVKADPLMYRPQASLSLPIWRDKIAATIAGAKARHDAAVARLTAEQLNLAAEIAQMLFMVREADRMIAYLDESALPNLERAAASAAAGYQSGMGGAAMIVDARHMALLMQLERAKALRERELAATDLLVVMAGEVPSAAPLLVQAPTAHR
ncbi:TolC family protein [Opitutus terrae]|uniref:TolC family protein n=1 Tax=Opitutus terrae TaxID=107709 RepID=UPI0005D11372|nr:TolC family protein [Opitutus terrae]